MKEETYTNVIKERISATSPGEIFVTADFSDLAPTNTANRILLRLEEKGTLRKVLRGVYQKPAYSEFLILSRHPPKKSHTQLLEIIIGQSPRQATQL